MELLNRLDAQLQTLAQQSLIRTRRVVDSPCGPRVRVDGRELLDFSRHASLIDSARL